MSKRVVILADGSFPTHVVPLGYLANAEVLVCCDGSVKQLIDAGFLPDAIVGDMDSISHELSARFSDRIYPDKDQETNDLTKAILWCKANNYVDVVILGATGKREDHTLGNISLLAEYVKTVKVIMVTDTGIFRPYLSGGIIDSFPGQQISIFSIDPGTEITSYGLKYPLSKTRISNWWVATLNECLGDSFTLEFEGRVIVYFRF